MIDNIIEIIKDNKGKCLTILILLILIIIISIFNIVSEKKVDNKNFKSSNYVFTKYENNNVKCPYININSKTINNINERLIRRYYKLVNEGNKMDYKYTINNNILSLLITITTKEIGYSTSSIEFISYNINLENNKIIKNNDLIKMYNLSSNEINDYILEELNNYYNIEVDEGYIENKECDLECYLFMHEIEDINSNIVYYIDKNNKLIAYLNHELETIYFDESDYKEFVYKYNLSNI